MNCLKSTFNTCCLILVNLLFLNMINAQSPLDAMAEICTCKNKDGLNPEEFAALKSVNENSSIEEISKTIPKLLNDKNSWVYQEFLSDETYMNNLKQIALKNIKETEKNPPVLETDPEKAKAEADQLLQEMQKDYPICYEFLPFLVSLTM